MFLLNAPLVLRDPFRFFLIFSFFWLIAGKSAAWVACPEKFLVNSQYAPEPHLLRGAETVRFKSLRSYHHI